MEGVWEVNKGLDSGDLKVEDQYMVLQLYQMMQNKTSFSIITEVKLLYEIQSMGIVREEKRFKICILVEDTQLN